MKAFVIRPHGLFFIIKIIDWLHYERISQPTRLPNMSLSETSHSMLAYLREHQVNCHITPNNQITLKGQFQLLTFIWWLQSTESECQIMTGIWGDSISYLMSIQHVTNNLLKMINSHTRYCQWSLDSIITNWIIFKYHSTVIVRLVHKLYNISFKPPTLHYLLGVACRFCKILRGWIKL